MHVAAAVFNPKVDEVVLNGHIRITNESRGVPTTIHCTRVMLRQCVCVGGKGLFVGLA